MLLTPLLQKNVVFVVSIQPHKEIPCSLYGLILMNFYSYVGKPGRPGFPRQKYLKQTNLLPAAAVEGRHVAIMAEKCIHEDLSIYT